MRLGTWRDLYVVGNRHYYGGVMVGIGIGFATAPFFIRPVPTERVVFFIVGMLVVSAGHWIAAQPRGSEVKEMSDAVPNDPHP